MTGFFDLSETDAVLAVAAAAAAGAWLVAAGIVFLGRRPSEPPVGPRTLELGLEPPAVANFLVNGLRVTGDAVPATLIDLAARNVVDMEQRGPGVFYVRLRPRRKRRSIPTSSGSSIICEPEPSTAWCPRTR
jgi:hypothetical protein